MLNRLLYGLTLIMVLIVINVFCFRINLNADTLFPLRYITSIQSGDPFLLFVQPGSRVLPEWAYSYIAYYFVQGPIPWSRVVIGMNILVLVYSLHYLFTKFGFQLYQKALWIVVMVLIIPVLYLAHQNVLIYFVFSPGIHGFYIPYLFICLGIYYQFINQKPIPKQLIILMSVIGALLISSNLNFVIMAIMPIVAVSVNLRLIGTIDKKQLLQVTGYSALVTSLGLILSTIFKISFGSIYFSANDFELFEQDLFEWLKQNSLFQEISNRKTSGYWLEISFLTIASSVWTLVYNKSQKVTPAFMLNLFFLLSIPIFLTTAWILDKGIIRLMPQVILLSPFLLVFNLTSGYLGTKTKKFTYSFALCFMLLATISTYVFYTESRPYIQHQFIHDKIQSLKSQNIIKGDGLSNYWIAHTNFSQTTKILPVSMYLRPNVFASDIQANWHYLNDRIKTPLMIDFVINDKRQSAKKWSINEKLLIKKMGKYSQSINYKFNKRLYKVYIYENGINSTGFYNALEDEISQLK